MSGPVKELTSLRENQFTPVTGVSGGPVEPGAGTGSSGVKEEICRDCEGTPLPFSVGEGHSENYPRDSYGPPGNIMLSVDEPGPPGGAEENRFELPITRSGPPTSKANIG